MTNKAGYIRDFILAASFATLMLIAIRQTVGIATVQKIRETQAELRPDPWTGNDSQRWVEEFHRLNPTIKIPDVKHEEKR